MRITDSIRTTKAIHINHIDIINLLRKLYPELMSGFSVQGVSVGTRTVSDDTPIEVIITSNLTEIDMEIK